MMFLWKTAHELVAKVHAGKFDKGGKPYYLHLIGVYELFNKKYIPENFFCSDEAFVCYLHDILEDGDEEVLKTLEQRFPETIVNAIKAITRNEGESYGDYIKRCSLNEIAKKVKICDLENNMDISRIKNPTSEDFKRIEKYKKWHAYLTEKV